MIGQTESDAVEDNRSAKSNKKLLNMTLRRVEITVIKQQLELNFIIFIDIKFRNFNFCAFLYFASIQN